MSVITISREFGSGGSSIAEKVAQTLGYHFTDKDTIGRVLTQYGLPEFKTEYDAVPPSFWTRFDTQRMERREMMVSLLNQTILALAHHGDTVILGRCGFAVLRGYADVLNVRIQASLPLRIKRVMDRRNIADSGRAEAAVKEGDKIRAAFVETFYGARWDAAGAFDVVIDTDKVSADLAAAWLVEAAKALQGRRGPEAHTTRTIQADSTLAAAVADELKCDVVHAS
jgi:cytidylate kinase